MGVSAILQNGKPMGKPMGKPWENRGKTMGKPWENHGKTHETALEILLSLDHLIFFVVLGVFETVFGSSPE